MNNSTPSRKIRNKAIRHIKVISSIIGSISALIAIIQFFVNIPPHPSVPPPLPTPQPTSTSLITPTPTPTPIPPHVHPVPCSTPTTEAGILKFFTQEGNVVCFSGVGTLDYTINAVVRVETGTTYASWLYVNLNDDLGVMHHSPQDNSFNCPDRNAKYLVKNRMQVTQVSIVSYATRCTSDKNSQSS